MSELTPVIVSQTQKAALDESPESLPCRLLVVVCAIVQGCIDGLHRKRRVRQKARGSEHAGRDIVETTDATLEQPFEGMFGQALDEAFKLTLPAKEFVCGGRKLVRDGRNWRGGGMDRQRLRAGLGSFVQVTAEFRNSQKRRKWIERFFSWLKNTAGLRKTRHRGYRKLDWNFTFAAAAYNLVRISKLLPAA